MNPSDVQLIQHDEAMALYVVRNFDLNVSGNRAMVLTKGYAVGTVAVVVTNGTGSTARLTPRVSNQPNHDTVASHPDGTAITPDASDGLCAVTKGLPLEHVWFGVEVTTIQGGASTCDLWICLKPQVTTPAI